jgi:hypothetical protein
VISHIVLFNPREGLSEDEVRLFAQQLYLTMTDIPAVVRATVGRRIEVDSDERLLGDVTYKYSAVIEFIDRPGLLDYLSHPLHRELGRLFWLSCGSTVVTEVETVDAKSPKVVDLLVMSQENS